MVKAQISLNLEATLNVGEGKWEYLWFTPPPFWFERLLICRL